MLKHILETHTELKIKVQHHHQEVMLLFQMRWTRDLSSNKLLTITT